MSEKIILVHFGSHQGITASTPESKLSDEPPELLSGGCVGVPDDDESEVLESSCWISFVTESSFSLSELGDGEAVFVVLCVELELEPELEPEEPLCFLPQDFVGSVPLIKYSVEA